MLNSQQYDQNGLDIVSVHLKVDRSIGSKQIYTPNDAVRIMGDVIKDLDREYLCVINMTNDNTPLNASIVSIGDYNTSEAKPILIVRPAILSGASKIIVMHNHVSGNVCPSREDNYVTKKIEDTCNIVGLEFLDHIIVGNHLCYSYKGEKTLLIQDYMRENVKEKYDEDKDITFKQIIEKYFITPDKQGYTYEDRMWEGYQMLELIAGDLDRIGNRKLNIKEYVNDLAKREGIIREDVEIKAIPYVAYQSR